MHNFFLFSMLFLAFHNSKIKKSLDILSDKLMYSKYKVFMKLLKKI